MYETVFLLTIFHYETQEVILFMRKFVITYNYWFMNFSKYISFAHIFMFTYYCEPLLEAFHFNESYALKLTIW